MVSHCIYVGKVLLFVTLLRSTVRKTKFVNKTSNLRVQSLYNLRHLIPIALCTNDIVYCTHGIHSVVFEKTGRSGQKTFLSLENTVQI